MRNLPLIFLGIFFTLAFSWTGIVLSSHIQLGGLEPTSSDLVEDPDNEGQLISDPDAEQYPLALSGEELRGKQVYIEMGCLYCHSQQVRRQGFGSDYERGWGDRQTVARDYIRQERVLLGTMRTGPDLSNVGRRIPTADWHHQHLYEPTSTSPDSLMPPFRFLYEVQEIGPGGPHPDALRMGPQYAPPQGYEIVPTQRAKDLVAYLLSLRLDYELPEMKFTQQ